MSKLSRIVDYHRKELYYEAYKAHNRCKQIINFHGKIRHAYKHNKLYFWYKTIRWFICDLPTFIACWCNRKRDLEFFINTYWDTKHRIKVQHKLEQRLQRYSYMFIFGMLCLLFATFVAYFVINKIVLRKDNNESKKKIR